MQTIVAMLKFVAGTLNSIALAFLVVGYINPRFERGDEVKPDPYLLEKFSGIFDGQVKLLSFQSGYNFNFLLTGALICATALLAIAFARNLEKD
ncbi:MAG: hypothetical protein ACE37J_01405 [Pikeienuella sp.]|uniref:hypothetical protein n=1 Tax=Pikeienuella sp. TaxID=2831957 RepID=UPI003918F9E5